LIDTDGVNPHFKRHRQYSSVFWQYSMDVDRYGKSVAPQYAVFGLLERFPSHIGYRPVGWQSHE
jgi:hypothetical protein